MHQLDDIANQVPLTMNRNWLRFGLANILGCKLADSNQSLSKGLTTAISLNQPLSLAALQRKLPVVGIGFVFDISFLAVIGSRRRASSTDTSLATGGANRGEYCSLVCSFG